MDDLYRIGGTSFVRHYSCSEAELRAKMGSLPPLVAGEIVFGFAAIRGEMLCITRMPEEMTAPCATQAVAKGVELALRRGAGVIGLGALTSPASGGGLKLLRHLPAGVTLTNGNAYTAAVVRHNVAEASAALALDRHARVAVVGATGSVGVPASHLLAEAGFDLILVGRSAKRARHRLGNLADQSVFAGDLDAVRGADVVVLLTSDPSARLAPDQVRAGSVVIDCAQPSNVAASAYDEFRRRRVAVVEGGIVRIPQYTCTLDIGLSDPRNTFACLAETYLFAREGIREHSVGRPSAELAHRLERAAQRHGVIPQPLGLWDRGPRGLPSLSSAHL
jgi:fatty aldehyde-generating acyl-ACP reductase